MNSFTATSREPRERPSAAVPQRTELATADVRIRANCATASAADDASAIAALQTPGDPAPNCSDVTALKNVDPIACTARPEPIMAACGYKDAPAARSEHLLSSPDAESAFVLSVSDTLCELLAGAIDDDLVRAAEPWPLAEELRSGHPADFETFEAYFDRRRPRHGPDAE